MQREDYILRMLEGIARMAARVMGFRRELKLDLAIDEVNRAAQEFFGMTVDLMLQLPEEGLAGLITDRAPASRQKLRAAAELLDSAAGVFEQSGDSQKAGRARSLAAFLLRQSAAENN